MRGDGYAYKRGNRWWIRYSTGGVDYREPCGKDVTTKQGARDTLQAVHRAIAQGTYLTPPERRATVDELLDGVLEHLRLQGAYLDAQPTTRNVSTLEGAQKAHNSGSHRKVRSS